MAAESAAIHRLNDLFPIRAGQTRPCLHLRRQGTFDQGLHWMPNRMRQVESRDNGELRVSEVCILLAIKGIRQRPSELILRPCRFSYKSVSSESTDAAVPVGETVPSIRSGTPCVVTDIQDRFDKAFGSEASADRARDGRLESGAGDRLVFQRANSANIAGGIKRRRA